MMKFSRTSSLTIILFIIIISLFFHIRYYSDYQTTLFPGAYIKDAASDLTSAYWSVPVVHDWDADGKKDLLIGHNHIQDRVNHGYVSFYKNIGTDSAPSFNGFTYLQTCDKVCSALNAAAFG